MHTVISIRDFPEYLEHGVDYFSSKWGVSRKIYHDSISHSITTKANLPRWYLLLKNDAPDREIIGSYGLITNDFISRQDLWPWLCALYIEEPVRRQGLGGLLLAHARREAAALGFPRLYLSTDHTSYYERYGWRHIGEGHHPWGATSRIYEIESDPCQATKS